jgi:TRAP-type C4-dicarboxylate transport system permease small subunit
MNDRVDPLEALEQGRPDEAFGRFLFFSARAIALFGGAVLVLIVCISFLSILGRFLFSSPLLGDFELVEMGCAVAISSFLPLCHLKNGNVMVDFLTSGLKPRVIMALDGISALAFALIAAFFTWRMLFGAYDMYSYKEETMLLQFPVWIPFLPFIFSFFLLSLCCFYTFSITIVSLCRSS